MNSASDSGMPDKRQGSPTNHEKRDLEFLKKISISPDRQFRFSKKFSSLVLTKTPTVQAVQHSGLPKLQRTSKNEIDFTSPFQAVEEQKKEANAQFDLSDNSRK